MLCIAKIALYRTFNPPAQLNKLDLQAKSPISHMPRIRAIHFIAENMIQKAISSYSNFWKYNGHGVQDRFMIQ